MALKIQTVEIVGIISLVLIIFGAFIGSVYITSIDSDAMTHPEMECVKEYAKSNRPANEILYICTGKPQPNSSGENTK